MNIHPNSHEITMIYNQSKHFIEFLNRTNRTYSDYLYVTLSSVQSTGSMKASMSNRVLMLTQFVVIRSPIRNIIKYTCKGLWITDIEMKWILCELKSEPETFKIRKSNFQIY